MNLSINTSTNSRILQQYNMILCITLRKPRIMPKQRRTRVDWCNEHLSWSVQDWSKVILSDESSYQVLNRIYFRLFLTDQSRFEWSQK